MKFVIVWIALISTGESQHRSVTLVDNLAAKEDCLRIANTFNENSAGWPKVRCIVVRKRVA